MKKILAVGCALLLAACSEEVREIVGEDVAAPDFSDPGQQAAEHFEWGADYPKGPYGFTLGSIIPSYKLVGYVSYINDLQTGIWDEQTGRWRQVISLSDLYNPTGDEVFPEGSPYGAGQPKPRALMLDISAAWCPPCQYEAEVTLPEAYGPCPPAGQPQPATCGLKDRGGQLLLALLEDVNGRPAKPSDLDIWVSTYQIDYLSTIGGSSGIMIYLDGAWPTNLIIDLRTMQVIERITGGPIQPSSAECQQQPYHPSCTFWPKFEEVIAGTFQYE